jgi:hypothetical protein
VAKACRFLAMKERVIVAARALFLVSGSFDYTIDVILSQW